MAMSLGEIEVASALISMVYVASSIVEGILRHVARRPPLLREVDVATNWCDVCHLGMRATKAIAM